MNLIIKNGTIVDPSQDIHEVGNVYIKDESIEKIVLKEDEVSGDAADVIDAAGKYVFPGFIDLHVHFRDPGLTYKEDIVTGSEAAAAGGVTTVCCMPNTKPVVDSVETLKDILDRAAELPIRLEQLSAITIGENNEELVDIAAMKEAGAIAFSEDGKSVMDSVLFEKGLKEIAKSGLVCMSHCEEKNLVQGGVINYGVASEKYNVKGIKNDVEDVIAARDIFMAAEEGARLHLCHCSTRGTVELMKMAKNMGLNVTAEVCPHHFVLSDSDITSVDGNFKMNPPLRSKEDVKALVEGLKSGVMDCISTDHAPHSAEEKSHGFDSPFGIVGLETSAALTYNYLVLKEDMPVDQMVRLMSYNPAKVIGLDKERGTLRSGAKADIVIFDPKKEWVVDTSKFRSKGKNTPFNGYELTGKCVTTICRGKVVYDETQQ